MSTGSLGLFALSTLIWGSTWLVITYQLGVVSAEASVVYRFALASVMLAAWCAATGRSLRFSLAQHRYLAVQGALLFGLNYLCVYWAEQYVASGLVAVLFSLIVFLNLAGVRIFFATPVSMRTALGSVLGVSGIVLLFWHDMSRGQTDAVRGIAFGLAATVLASAGNLIAARNQRHNFPILPGTAWAMGYGAVAIAVVATLTGAHWSFDVRMPYVLSLVYLAALGSVVAFGAYLTLLGRIGAGRAGYVGVAVPVIALAFSTVFEHYQWNPLSLVGVALCIAGNLLVLLPGSVFSRA